MLSRVEYGLDAGSIDQQGGLLSIAACHRTHVMGAEELQERQHSDMGMNA